MGFLSLLGKAAKVAVTVASNLDKVDSVSNVVDNLPDFLEKAKVTVDKVKDMASSAEINIRNKQGDKKDIAHGRNNEMKVKIYKEELLDCIYSVPVRYENIFPIGRDLLKAKLEGKYGVIDIDNNIIIPFEYDEIENISEELIPVKKDGKYGFVNLKNEVVIDIEFFEVRSFSCGLAPAAKDLMQWGYINKDGVFVIEPTFYDADPFEKNGLARIYKGFSESGVIDIEGKIIVKPEYHFVEINKNDITFQKDIRGNYYYCDLKGTPLASAENYNNVETIQEDGYNQLFSTGEVSFSCRSGYYEFPDRKIFVYNTSQMLYGWYEEIDGEAICRIEPIYDEFVRTKYNPSEGGYSVVKHGGLYGVIKISKSV